MKPHHHHARHPEKDNIKGGDQEKIETAQVMFFVLDHSLRLLHPFMPFITEEIWQMLADRGEKSIAFASFPSSKVSSNFEKAWKEVNLLNRTITTIRSIRQETGVALSEPVSVQLMAGASESQLYRDIEPMLRKQGKVKDVQMISTFPKIPCAVAKTEKVLVAIPLQGLIDINKEKARQEKKKSKLEKDQVQINHQLQNPKFVDNAPEELIQEKKDLLMDVQDRLQLIEQALATLEN